MENSFKHIRNIPAYLYIIYSLMNSENRKRLPSLIRPYSPNSSSSSSNPAPNSSSSSSSSSSAQNSPLTNEIAASLNSINGVASFIAATLPPSPNSSDNFEEELNSEWQLVVHNLLRFSDSNGRTGIIYFSNREIAFVFDNIDMTILSSAPSPITQEWLEENFIKYFILRIKSIKTSSIRENGSPNLFICTDLGIISIDGFNEIVFAGDDLSAHMTSSPISADSLTNHPILPFRTPSGELNYVIFNGTNAIIVNISAGVPQLLTVTPRNSDQILNSAHMAPLIVEQYDVLALATAVLSNGRNTAALDHLSFSSEAEIHNLHIRYLAYIDNLNMDREGMQLSNNLVRSLLMTRLAYPESTANILPAENLEGSLPSIFRATPQEMFTAIRNVEKGGFETLMRIIEDRMFDEAAPQAEEIPAATESPETTDNPPVTAAVPANDAEISAFGNEPEISGDSSKILGDSSHG